jgi:hypothetical protein
MENREVTIKCIDRLAQSLTTGYTRRGGVAIVTATALGGLASLAGWESAKANDRQKRRRRRRKQRRRGQDRKQTRDSAPMADLCVPNAIPFTPPTGFCSEDNQCCDAGHCCALGDAPQACYDLLTNPVACGRSCDAIVNCVNTDKQCVNGECVDF